MDAAGYMMWIWTGSLLFDNLKSLITSRKIPSCGFLENSIVETVQSMAFFNVPGTPIAYSGVQINMPSASL